MAVIGASKWSGLMLSAASTKGMLTIAITLRRHLAQITRPVEKLLSSWYSVCNGKGTSPTTSDVLIRNALTQALITRLYILSLPNRN